MRKGFFVTLAIVAIALISGSVYGFAPVIGNIPDVVIGDLEDGDSNNFFRFTNAFNFLDYVDDQDTTKTLLKWSFIEEGSPGGTPANWFELNDVTQTTVGSTNPPPGPKDLTLGGTDYDPDIRDIYASPSSGDPGPYTGIVEAGGRHDKFITLYASDGTREDSTNVFVYSIDGELDSLSGGAIFIQKDTYESTQDGWLFLGLVGSNFVGASSSYTGGRLGISSADDATNRVGFWQSPVDIAYIADNVYRARYLVSSNAATAAQNPQFRMRYTHEFALQSATQVVNASGSYSHSLPIDPAQTEYTCYFAPVVSGNLGVAFDMLDFTDTQYGEHYVDEVTVERFPDPIPGTAVKTYTDTADFASWGFAAVGFDPVTSGGSGTGTLSITSVTADANNYGWWQSGGTTNELTYVADKLYRATYTLRCASDAARNDMPQIRLRMQSEDNQMTATMELNSQGTGGPGAMPETGGSDYELYAETPTLPGSPSATEDGFIVTIDMLDFNSTQGGTIYMDSVAVDYLAIP